MKGFVTKSALAMSLMAMTGFVVAQDFEVKLPSTVAWSTYDVGSGGYNQAAAIGNALKNKYGVNLRVLPGKNDVSRAMPLNRGQVQFAATGIAGTYHAQEGLDDFAGKMWGPQPIRAVLQNNSDQLVAVVVAADAGIVEPKDLKGKRVAWLIAAPSVNAGVTGALRFGDLTWDDVEKVEFGGFGASMDGMMQNRVDAAISSSISGKAYEAAKSQRGLSYLHMPAEDVEGWARLHEVAPFVTPVVATEGANLSKDSPAISGTYPYPVLATLSKTDGDLVRSMLVAMDETFDSYRDVAPGNNGWGLDRQNLSWVVPYHDGAVEFFKSKGMWTDEDQANNDALIARQEILMKTWDEVNKQQHANDEEFVQNWLKARYEALEAAGLETGTPKTW